MTTPQIRIENLRNCVIVGGAGAVGSMFANLLAGAGARVFVVDRKLPLLGPKFAEDAAEGDITAPDARVRELLGQADLVLLAVPEAVGLAALGSVARAMRRGALVVETSSVKSPIADAFLSCEPDVEVLGVNPLFAPSLGMAGRVVFAVVVRGGPRSEEFLRLLTGWEARIVRMDACQHDHLTAATQALTHAAILAFGFALGELNPDIETLSRVAPPPHTMMLSLLARVASGAPEVYWEIQAFNPGAVHARQALVRGIPQALRVAGEGG